MKMLWPGTRVKVFDHLLFADDVTTPLSMTMKEATVTQWYGRRATAYDGFYENVVDVRFDHRPERISRAHFARGVEILA